jgi:hypothetical protein
MFGKSRKHPPNDNDNISRTFKLALTSHAQHTTSTISLAPELRQATQIVHNTKDVPQPRTQTEQYWAARALTAETLLAAKSAHQLELREATHGEEEKRKVSKFVLGL